MVRQGTTDLETRLERCPRLESVFNEVLHLAASSSSIRMVSSTTEIGGKIIPSGTKVLILFRQLHFDENIFGDNALQFDPDRFLKNKALG